MRLVTSFLILFTTLAPTAAWPRDVFAMATGFWGIADFADMTCENNPHSYSFSRDRTLSVFRWRKPVHNADGTVVTEVRYRVLAAGRYRITLERISDGQRFKLILAWDGQSYRFGPVGEPESSYFGVYRRCTDLTS